MAQTVTPINPHAHLSKIAAITQADWIDARVLAAGVAETYQAPAGAKYVRIAGDGTFYAKIAAASTAAAVPAADIVDGTASELMPAGAVEFRTLPVDQAFISLIASAACVVTLSFYRN